MEIVMSKVARSHSRPGGAPNTSHIITIQLMNYWHETITRKEAERRLATRQLDDKTLRDFERDIPDVAHHYLTFTRTMFREFVSLDVRPAIMLLTLPLRVRAGKHVVAIPVMGERRDGRMRRVFG